jgi:hypothetical protein
LERVGLCVGDDDEEGKHEEGGAGDGGDGGVDGVGGAEAVWRLSLLG